MIELDIGFGQVVVFDVKEALWAHVSHIEVTRLNRVNEILVGRLEGIVRVHRWELSLIGSDESIGVTSAQLHRRLLGFDLTNGLFLALPSTGSTSDRVVCRHILLMLWKTRSNAEVGHLVLHLAASLCLAAPSLT